MLQIFAGRSGSGKTEEIFRRICDDAGKKDIVLIVPEQSSFQSERRILNMLGTKKASLVSVLSFKRLCDKVSEIYGGITAKRIDDGDRAVFMSLAVQQLSDKLTLYGVGNSRNDLVEIMLNAVKEYKMCAISVDTLFSTAQKIKNKRLRQKLEESAAIYEAYSAMLGRTYCDPDDDLVYLYNLLCKNPYFKGKTVYIDSFNGFSGQEKKIIECIIKQADYTGITLGCDKISVRDIKSSIFAEPNKTMLNLKEIAEMCGSEIAEDIWFEEQKRFKSSAVAAIEESVFRFDGDKYTNDGSVELYKAEDEYDEVQQTARDISKLVRDNDYVYRDITVICRNIDNYKNIIESEFQKFDIPFFMSNPQSTESKPLIKLIIGAFETVHSSFDTEKVFSFLKTGLTKVDTDEIFMLENYVYMWDIRGKAWKQPFTLNPDGNTDRENNEELLKLEDIRKRAVEPLELFGEEIKKAENGGEISRAVFMLLSRMDTAGKIKKLVGYFDKLGEIKAKEEQARIWDLTINILDKMYNILSNVHIDSKQYFELLLLMIRKSPVSDIPQTLDSVTVGTAGNIRSDNPRAVFVLGAVENSFPAVPEVSGIFGDSEREQLINADLPLYDTLYSSSLKEKYIAYSALCAPKERLFVSFCKSNVSGEQCEPSVIVRELCAMFDNINIRTKRELQNEDIFFTPRQSFEICASEWNDNTLLSESLKNYFISDSEYRSRTAAIERAVLDVPFSIKNPVIPKRLFGEKPVLSASQIELYYLCPFAYFCKYGLSAMPSKKASMTSSLYGSAVHFILEKILSETDFDEFKAYSTKELDELVEKYLAEYIKCIGGDEKRTKRFISQCRSMKKNIVIVIERLVEEFKNSSFRPSDFELSIGGDDGGILPYELEMPNGNRVSVVGKIDRVDTYVKDNQKYIRVVDYKTGNKKFRLSDILYGLNMQMLLYLSAIQKNGTERYSENKERTIVPAGVLYMPSTPASEAALYNSGEQRKNLINDRSKSFKMNGIIIDDSEIILAMENGAKGIYIPAALKKDGSFSAASSLASLEDFGKIFHSIDKKIINMAYSVLNGNIERKPSKGSVDACEYCDYKTVCGYEEGKPNRNVVNIKTNEALESLRREDNNE